MFEFDQISLSSQTLSIISAFADQMPGGFFIYRADEKEELLLSNSAMHRIMGCETLDEFRQYTGNTFNGLVYPEDLDMVEDSIQRQILQSTEKTDYVEYRIRTKSGHIKWLKDYGRFIETEEFGPVFFVFVSDVTAEHSDIMLENSLFGETLSALTSEFSSVYYVNLEEDSFVLFKNEGKFSAKSASLITPGTTYSSAIQAAIYGLVCEEDREKMLHVTSPSYLREALLSNNTLNCRYRVNASLGGALNHNLKIVRCSQEKPGIRFVMGFERIDQLVQEEQAREAELLAASSAKTSFLFNMSHDIRTPLNAVLGYTKLIAQNIDNKEKVLDYRAKIERSGDYLLGIINNVLEMSKIESGTLELEQNYVYVGGTIANIIDVYSGIIAEKNLQLHHTVTVTHQHVLGDAPKIREIFGNLLSNAIKYTPEGGTITVTTDELPSDDPSKVIIRTSVRDTGIGMSSDFIPHIFDNFSRERNSTTSRVIGTGLGMPIVKKMVDLLGGTIEIESELGKGSCFTVTMSHLLADEHDYSFKNATASSDSVDPASLMGIRILLAEDNDLNAEITCALLENLGIQVDRAEDGLSCLSTLLNTPDYTYSLILMDIQMPNMNGYETAKAIRSLENQSKAEIPILAMTANAFEEDRRQAANAGMNGHIAKPIEIPILISEISSVIHAGANKLET